MPDETEILLVHKKRKVLRNGKVNPVPTMFSTAMKTTNAGNPPQLVLPNNALGWAISTVNLFKQEKVPERLLCLVEKWIEFETHEKDWGHSGKLSVVEHPKPMADWINHARMECFRLQAPTSGVNPVRDFESKFWLWWSQLQPEFCQRDESEVVLALDHEGHADGKTEGDWSML